MNRRTFPVVSVILYVLAALVLLFSIWALTNAITYISEMIQTGQITVSGSEFDIVSFYMSTAGQYAVYSVMLFALGLILQRTRPCVPDDMDVWDDDEVYVDDLDDLDEDDEDDEDDEGWAKGGDTEVQP